MRGDERGRGSDEQWGRERARKGGWRREGHQGSTHLVHLRRRLVGARRAAGGARGGLAGTALTLVVELKNDLLNIKTNGLISE